MLSESNLKSLSKGAETNDESISEKKKAKNLASKNEDSILLSFL